MSSETTPPQKSTFAASSADIVGFPGSRVSLSGRTSEAVAFSKQELSAILAVYGRMVAVGEWRDYALDFGREEASFAIFRRSSEVPLARIVKIPRLQKKQGAFAVVSGNGLVLKRGHDIVRVLAFFDDRPKLVR